MRQITWLQFGISEAQLDDHNIFFIVERKNYFCVQKTYPLEIGRDIRKVVQTESRTISPYDNGLVSYWIKKINQEYVVTFWAYKPSFLAQVSEFNPLFLLPETFNLDIDDGVSAIGTKVDNKELISKLKKFALQSPVNISQSFLFKPTIDKLQAPLTRGFFVKWLSLTMVASVIYLALVSAIQFGLKQVAESGKNANQPLVSEYFSIKGKVDVTTTQLENQTLLVRNQNSTSELIILLDSFKEKHGLVVRQLNLSRGSYLLSVESNNANDFMQALMQETGVSNLSLQGAVNKTNGTVRKDSYRIQFNWDAKIWN